MEKLTLLDALPHGTLKRLVSSFDLDGSGVDLRARRSLLQALGRAPAVTLPRLVAELEDAELRQVCALQGIAARGPRAHLAEAVLGGAPAPPPRALSLPLSFVALDFETADYQRDSACSVALVRVEDGRIVDRVVQLLRPPRRTFLFTSLHGIAWHHVKDQPSFAEAWPRLRPLLRGVPYLAAHNAPFDRSVLRTCCEDASLAPPDLPYLCTMRLSRARFAHLGSARLNVVCQHLRIPLQHHQAGSDAEACARIIISVGAEATRFVR